jgi:hypothetical protein
MKLRNLSADAPLSTKEIIDLNKHLDSIELRLTDDNITDIEIINLLTELEKIHKYTEYATTISKFNLKGFSIVK